MPDWTIYFTAGTSTSVPLGSITQQQYEDYQTECERQDQIYELQLLQEQTELEEERQLIKDKERYPLFFLKEGIV